MVTRYSLVCARAAVEDIKHVHDILEHWLSSFSSEKKNHSLILHALPYVVIIYIIIYFFLC